MHRSRPAVLAAALALNLGAAALLFSQSLAPDEVRVSSRPFVPQSATALRVTSQFVEVGAVVRDTRGRAIAGLKQSDFQILDDNKPQTIATFSIETLTSNEPPPDSSPATSSASPTAAAPAPSSRRPRNVAIYFDDIHTDSGDFERAKIAASSLVKNGVQSNDRLAIFTGSSTVTLAFTTDSAKVVDAISHLQPHPRMSPNGVLGCPKITPYDSYLMVDNLDPVVKARVYDESVRCNCDSAEPDPSCAQTAQKLADMKAQETWSLALQLSKITFGTLNGVIAALSHFDGDRILVFASGGYVSDGIELGQQQDALISQALRAGVIVNSLDLKGLYAEGPGGGIDSLKDLNKNTDSMSSYEVMYDSIIRGQRLTAMTSSMGEMSLGTGGYFFQNNNDLGAGFHRLADAPAVEYVMTYSPASLKTDGKFHKIQVKLASQNSYAIESRRGYYAPTKESQKAEVAAAAAAQPSPEQKFEREATSEGVLEDLPAQLSAHAARDATGASVLNVDIHVDLSKINFQQQKDRHVQQLNFIVALFDDKAN
ncbi:MAG TPA: VWA domain-containing protein, partial [Candidatus Acidoferrales bacterium]|nr:VWA domain-containing protein [Candidatus Acidoferrales bacterium]